MLCLFYVGFKAHTAYEVKIAFNSVADNFLLSLNKLLYTNALLGLWKLIKFGLLILKGNFGHIF